MKPCEEFRAQILNCSSELKNCSIVDELREEVNFVFGFDE